MRIKDRLPSVYQGSVETCQEQLDFFFGKTDIYYEHRRQRRRERETSPVPFSFIPGEKRQQCQQNLLKEEINHGKLSEIQSSGSTGGTGLS